MVVQGNLEHFLLRVSYREKGAAWVKHMQQRQDKDMEMFKRPPLEGLLRVLADPYLRTAELWVDVNHIPVWCRFHAGQPCGRAHVHPPISGAPPDNPPTRSPGVDSRDCAVEIDWRELRRVVDPERRDVAVAWTEDLRTMRHGHG